MIKFLGAIIGSVIAFITALFGGFYFGKKYEHARIRSELETRAWELKKRKAYMKGNYNEAIGKVNQIEADYPRDTDPNINGERMRLRCLALARYLLQTKTVEETNYEEP